MDELTIDGKIYVSSKKAAAISGYAKDYVGQLCREGRVDSKLVGRSWYVYEPSIREHRFNDERAKGRGGKDRGNDEKKNDEASEKTNIQAVWERPSYSSESFEPMPVLAENEASARDILQEETPKTVFQMQSAWQEWFKDGGEEGIEEKRINTVEEEQRAFVTPQKPLIEEIKPHTAVPIESVPLRMIVSDIEPKTPHIEERKVEIERPHRVREVEPPQYRMEERPHQTTIHHRTVIHKKKEKRVITKALLIALMVVSISIVLVATGLIEEIHLGGLTNSPVFNYIQGINSVNK